MPKPNKRSNESKYKPCKVCQDAESKYKCPLCLIPYCSLFCFKKHKETQCAKPVSAPESDTSIIIPPIDVERPFYVDNAEDVLQQSQLESIASSTEILDVLKDKQIQRLICNIDCSADAGNELDKAMEHEVFRLFTERILSRVNQSGNEQL